MNTNYERLIGDATRLTRTGDLAAATRAIREALGDQAPSPARYSAANSVPPTGGTAPDAHGEAPERDASVIEGEWRRIEDDGASSSTAGTAYEPRVDTDDRGRSEDLVERDGHVVRARHDARGGSLDYRLYAPARRQDSPAPPLLVMLHGCTQNADDFAVGTRMDALAAEHGFLVLYPDQSDRANPQRCWNWFKHTHQRRGGGEAGLIEACVRAVVDEHGADPRRVFVAGLSAGGAMAAILGNVCPDLFAGVGVHSGLAAGAATNLPEALAAMRGGQGALAPSSRAGGGSPPTIVFHGDADRTVHPDNGEHVVGVCLAAPGGAAAAAPAVDRGEKVNGDRGWTRCVHRDAAGRVLAEHWLVHGAGHAWSGGDRRGSYVDGAGPDASAEMVRFFLSLPR